MLEVRDTLKHGASLQPKDESRPSTVAGVLLCGGKSVRMGSDKALLELDGKRLFEYPLALLDELCGSVVLACGPAERYADLGRPLALDAEADAGPLAGLVAGLGATDAEWVLALGCDMPSVTIEHAAALLDEAARRSLDICVYESARGPEPLCAVYRSTCLSPARAALAAGQRRLVSFWKEPLLIGRLPAPEAALANLNTLEDLARERARRNAEEAP